MMPCPMHSTAPVTKRPVPVEVYPHQGSPPFRVSGAEMETCGQCGASYYDWVAVAKLPAQALVVAPAPQQEGLFP